MLIGPTNARCHDCEPWMRPMKLRLPLGLMAMDSILISACSPTPTKTCRRPWEAASEDGDLRPTDRLPLNCHSYRQPVPGAKAVKTTASFGKTQASPHAFPRSVYLPLCRRCTQKRSRNHERTRYLLFAGRVFTGMSKFVDHAGTTALILTVASIRYLDLFVKLDGRWFFKQRRVVCDWTGDRPLFSG